MNNIILIGPMGSVKSTIGRLLAKKLNAQFIDTDEVLELRTGVSVATIFEIEGESGFREREVKLVEELRGSNAVVIATGGGAVLDVKNREALKETGFVVYLKAELEVLCDRLRGGKGRPLLDSVNLEQKISTILEERHDIYLECANVVIETGFIGVNEMVDEIIEVACVLND